MAATIAKEIVTYTPKYNAVKSNTIKGNSSSLTDLRPPTLYYCQSDEAVREISITNTISSPVETQNSVVVLHKPRNCLRSITDRIGGTIEEQQTTLLSRLN